MTVLITGGGLLGAQTAAKFVARGDTPVLYDIAYNWRYLEATVDTTKVKTVVGDVLDLPLLLDTIKEEKIDRIIHTASLLDSAVRERPFTGVRTNVLGMMNVLEAARVMDLKRVIFTSSVMVQSGARDSLEDGLYKEDFPMRCLTNMPVNIYGCTKLMSEYLGLHYYKSYGVDFAALRVCGLFGPWLGTASGRPSRFCDIFVKNAAFGQPVIIEDQSDTYQGVQNFVYSKDVAQACMLACLTNNELKSRVYNVAGDKTYSFDEVIDISKRVFPGVEIQVKEMSEIGWGNMPANRGYYDISKARHEFGYEPEYGLEAAFKDYGDWLRRYAQP